MFTIKFENGRTETVSGMTYNMACFWAEMFGDGVAYTIEEI